MAEEKLLTVREVSSFLDISEKEVMELAESGRLAAYKVGGVYLRFKKEQVYDFRKINKPQLHKRQKQGYSFGERISDFFYFNDFYILAVLITILLLFVILRG